MMEGWNIGKKSEMKGFRFSLIPLFHPGKKSKKTVIATPDLIRGTQSHHSQPIDFIFHLVRLRRRSTRCASACAASSSQ
jgi:hypothetical protein